MVSQKLHKIGMSIREGPQITKGVNCMENNPKVKGKNNENSHSETMNHFEILVMKSQDKRGHKREIFILNEIF